MKYNIEIIAQTAPEILIVCGFIGAFSGVVSNISALTRLGVFGILLGSFLYCLREKIIKL